MLPEGWTLTVLDEIDSTNDALKRHPSAPHGTVLAARKQTGGRGRRGRRFVSPPGGVYLSVLLRPEAPIAQLLHLTPMTALAIRRAIFDACAVEVQIKWINDLVYGGKKLCGILTEPVGDAVIIGVGVNCSTAPEEFPTEVRQMATSLRQITGNAPDPDVLIAAMVRRLHEMDAALLHGREEWMREYAAACVTLGKTVQIVRGEERRTAFAEGIDASGALLVRYENGETAAINSGEASVRGMYGYL